VRPYPEERGISTVVVVASLLGLFAATLLSVDFGSMWSTRRRIVSGTDATALDQAIFAARTGATDCNRVGTATFDARYQDWRNILQVNTNGFVAGSESCRFVGVGSGGIVGYVAVEARKRAETRFGGLFGLGDTQPYSFSAARIYYPDALRGLRPIGICIDNRHVQEWLAYLDNGTPMPQPGSSPDHPVYAGAGTVHRIQYGKDDQDDCGNAPGNWGFQDFDGPDSGNSNDQFKDWLLNGYDGLVNAPGDCNNDGSPDPCPGDPGAGSGNSNQDCPGNVTTIGEALSCIRSIPGNPPVIKEFPIVIFDSATCNQGGGGGGNTCAFNVVRYVGVRLWGFDLNGAQARRWFDFEFVPFVGTGPCCARSPNQTDVKAVELCAVDHDAPGRTEASRCAP
jgi:hypothetical protein